MSFFSKLLRLKSRIPPAQADGALKGLSSLEAAQAEWARRRVTVVLAVGDGRMEGLGVHVKALFKQPSLHSVILVYHKAPPALREQWHHWVDDSERMVVMESACADAGGQWQEAARLAAGRYVAAVSPYANLPEDALEGMLAVVEKTGGVNGLRVQDGWHHILAGWREKIWRYCARYMLRHVPQDGRAALPSLLAMMWPKGVDVPFERAAQGVPHGAALNALAWYYAQNGNPVTLVTLPAAVALPPESIGQWWNWVMPRLQQAAPTFHRSLLWLATRATSRLEAI
ncbi:hypothetical protein GC177_00270 [bacterium]|nr:hypothetical protein [bacterium]